MRLIDADVFLEHEIKRCDGDMPYIGTCATTNFTLVSELSRMPTVDAVPVRHGHWVEINLPIKTEYECSVCHKKDSKSTAIRGHYCWYCGAKMDEVSDNGT